MIYIQLAVGLVILLVGGELLVRGAVATATRAGVSRLLIGLTVVGFGTSTPELITSVEAAFLGAPGIAVGNVVGSNIANILLILGIAALIYPLQVSRGAFYRDGTAVTLATLCGVAVCLTGELRPPGGVILLALLLAYIIYCYRAERVSRISTEGPMHSAPVVPETIDLPLSVSIVFIVGGLALTMSGAHLLVSSALSIGAKAGISETTLGLTVVAVGTSLPELATSVLAAIRRQADIAFGNIIGSNIFNILAILGITAILEPIRVPPELLQADVWIMLGATVMLLLFSISGWRISRIEGGVLLVAYGGYLLLVVS